MVIQKVTSFLLTVAILSLCSGLSLYFGASFFIDKLYEQTLLDEFLIATMFISFTGLLYLFVRYFFKSKIKSLLISGMICSFIDILLFLLIISVFFEMNRFLMHFICVSTYCFFIPYTYFKFKSII